MKKSIIKRSFILVFVLYMVSVMAISVSAASSKAKLYVQDYKTREIISYTYSITHDTNSDDQLTGPVKGGTITIEVKACNDGNSELLEWMLNNNLMKNGEIVVFEPSTDKVMKKIIFKDAYCINYKEGRTEGKAHTEIITISCRVLNIGNASLEKNWETEDPTGSVFSIGNLCIIIGVAVIAVGGITALVIVKKKKKHITE